MSTAWKFSAVAIPALAGISVPSSTIFAARGADTWSTRPASAPLRPSAAWTASNTAASAALGDGAAAGTARGVRVASRAPRSPCATFAASP